MKQNKPTYEEQILDGIDVTIEAYQKLKEKFRKRVAERRKHEI